MLDQYLLGQSIVKELVGVGAEIRLDLKLADNPYLNAGTVSGIIKDSEGARLAEVVIKVLDHEGNPLLHTISNLAGEYFLTNLLPGNYSLLVIKDEFLLAKQRITIEKQAELIVNWTLKRDPNWDLAIINGHLMKAETGLPLQGSIFLSTLCGGTKERIIAKTISNQFGQFVFQNIVPGRYRIIATANLYQTKTAELKVLPGRSIINQEFQLTLDPFACLGTTSGQISDEHGKPIKNGLVVLYCVENEKFKPVMFTHTNFNGDYLFTGLKENKYLIKANLVKDSDC